MRLPQGFQPRVQCFSSMHQQKTHKKINVCQLYEHWNVVHLICKNILTRWEFVQEVIKLEHTGRARNFLVLDDVDILNNEHIHNPYISLCMIQHVHSKFCSGDVEEGGIECGLNY